MAHTLVTLSAGDITRKALSILHNELVFCKTINKQYDDRFARSGAKNGGTLLIREPNEFTVRTGQTMDAQDLVENTQTLTVGTQLGVDINFSSVELDPVSGRLLRQDSDPCNGSPCDGSGQDRYHGLLSRVSGIYVIGTLGTQPTIADILSARAKLAQSLTPAGQKIIMCDSLASNAIMASAASYFHSGSQIEKQYEQGLVGNLHGFKFYETEMTPTHTNGPRTDTTPVVSTTALEVLTTATSGGHNVISMVGNATGTTILPGDVFTIAGIYQVNPESKAVMSNVQQFVVTATVAASTSACNIYVEPAIYTSGPYQTVKIVTTAASALVTHLGLWFGRYRLSEQPCLPQGCVHDGHGGS